MRDAENGIGHFNFPTGSPPGKIHIPDCNYSHINCQQIKCLPVNIHLLTTLLSFTFYLKKKRTNLIIVNVKYVGYRKKKELAG